VQGATKLNIESRREHFPSFPSTLASLASQLCFLNPFRSPILVVTCQFYPLSKLSEHRSPLSSHTSPQDPRWEHPAALADALNGKFWSVGCRLVLVLWLILTISDYQYTSTMMICFDQSYIVILVYVHHADSHSWWNGTRSLGVFLPMWEQIHWFAQKILFSLLK